MLQVCLSLPFYLSGDLFLTTLVIMLPKLTCWIVRYDPVNPEDIDYEDLNVSKWLPSNCGSLVLDSNLWIGGGRSSHWLDTGFVNQLKDNVFFVLEGLADNSFSIFWYLW